MKIDPELEMQERGGWLADLCAWVAWIMPFVPILLFYGFMFATAVIIVIHYLIIPVL